MSAKKFSNFFHLPQIVMPLPPYIGQSALFRLVHRFIIRAQAAYTLVLDMPCVLELRFGSDKRQPHDLVDPLRKCNRKTDLTLPQSHLQTAFWPAGVATTTSLPKRTPSMFIFAGMATLFLAGCSISIPNVTVCSTSGYMSAGADCASSLSDETKALTLDEWIAFLEPDVATGRGAALCLSSDDFTKLKTALDQACHKLGRWCSKEIKEETEKASIRVASLQSKVLAKKRNKR